MKPDLATRTLRVARRAEDAQDIVVLELVAEDGELLPEFSAGSHLDIHLGNDLVRQYSICSDPANRDSYRLGVLREVESRGGSAFVHANLSEGDLVEVGPPRNNFPCDESATRSVLIGGGIGITPMIAMAHRLDSLGASYAVHYCCRAAARVAFRSVLVEGQLARNVRLHLGDDPACGRFSLIEDVGHPEPGTHIYVCGSSGFTESILTAARGLGWPDEQLHTESFTPQTQPEDGDRPIQVTAARSGVTMTVGAAQTVASALMEAGVDVPLSCEQGICGTCVTRVIEGQPLHRDDFLSDLEKKSNKVMTVCCSRARSASLVLDI